MEIHGPQRREQDFDSRIKVAGNFHSFNQRARTMVEISAREYSAARTQIRERGDRDIIYTTEET